MERIEYIPNTPEAIRDALARGGRILGARSGGMDLDSATTRYSTGDIVSVLADGTMVAVAFHVVADVIDGTARVVRKAKSLVKAIKGNKRKKEEPKAGTASASKMAEDGAAKVGPKKKHMGPTEKRAGAKQRAAVKKGPVRHGTTKRSPRT